MTKKTKRVPSLRRHKARNLGFVELNGRRIYLGRYDEPQTEQKYHRLIAEWVENGRRLPVAQDEVTIVELIARDLHG